LLQLLQLLQMMNTRSVCEPLKKRVAFSQKYVCAGTCGALLPPTYETDHILALADGGDNSFENLQCLCNNCHAAKTAEWRIQKSIAARTPNYENRWDVHTPAKTSRCTLCGEVRGINAPPHVACVAIDAPTRSGMRLENTMFKFGFVARSLKNNA
jgi:hypothetical protein